MSGTAIRPFRIEIPQADLAERLARTRKAGSSRQGVEVRAMNTIAAKQLRSDMVRCRPPYGAGAAPAATAPRSPTADPV
jgi:hypothetical protein